MTPEIEHDAEARLAFEPRVSRCSDCGAVLTIEESHYYEYRCEDCEADWADRMARYRAGADDPILDLFFSG